jgi:hypothetical protein
LRWSGSAGFVATFNAQEFNLAIVLTAVLSVIATVLFANNEFPVWLNAVIAAFAVSMTLLFIGWVRQIARYTKTVGVLYAVTDSRLLIFRRKRIVAQMPIEAVVNTAVKKKFFGNGTVVFNEGEDFFQRGNILEAPTRRIFAFFNVLDPDNVVKLIKGNKNI